MREDRLLILADHLLNGQLGHAKFDFSAFNTNGNFTIWENPKWKAPVHGCRTNGCAIGECPIIWPEKWRFGNIHGGLDVPTYGNMTTKIAAANWFDITEDQVSYLFFPIQLSCEGVLDVSATRKEVANHIIKFVKKKLK